jgi:hypothetical protein
MAKFSSVATRPNVSDVVRTTGVQTRTFEGASGYERDAKSELFLLAVSNFVREGTFYEKGGERDDRFEALVRAVTTEDPDWARRLIPWLRNGAQMRSASLVAAAEYVKAGGDHGRLVVSSVLQRADEPGELLAYWFQRHGRRVPQPVKRGVADAVVRLYSERSALKYDGQGKAWRFADVVDLVHPKPASDAQAQLFKYLLDARHDHATELPPVMARAKAVAARLELGEDVPAAEVKAAGVTWERQSSNTKMDAAAWERQIPSMGYMALLRNLRNFDQAGINDDVARSVEAKLTDPGEVARSRQFPMRFLSAAKALQSVRWLPALERALDLSLGNVPQLAGRTLVLMDVSGSMYVPAAGENSALQRWEAAAVFGLALGLRAAKADVYAYSNDAKKLKLSRRASVLRLVEQLRGFGGGGTATWQTLQRTYDKHDRVVILTDEQASFGAQDPGPGFVPLIYTWNLAGYRPAHSRSGEHGRYTFGGLTDKAAVVIPLLEEAKEGNWPF